MSLYTSNIRSCQSGLQKNHELYIPESLQKRTSPIPCRLLNPLLGRNLPSKPPTPRFQGCNSKSPLTLSSPVLDTGHNDWSIFDCTTIRPIALHHEINCETQLPATTSRRNSLSKSTLHNLRIKSNTSDIVSPSHKPLQLPRLSVNILSKNFHHIFFRVSGLVCTSMAVGRNVELFVGMEQAEYVA